MKQDILRRTEHSVGHWVQTKFGSVGLEPKERGLRCAEEAIELGQALTVDREAMHKLVDHVYDRPVGDPVEEIGGVMICVQAAASILGISINDQADKEWERINTLPQEHFDRATERKAAAGVDGMGS